MVMSNPDRWNFEKRPGFEKSHSRTWVTLQLVELLAAQGFFFDQDMLWNGEYSMPLKKRVAGRLGHLNNAQSVELLRSLLPESLRFVMAAHLSEANNTPELVERELSGIMDGAECQYDIASQHKVSDWISVGDLC